MDERPDETRGDPGRGDLGNDKRQVAPATARNRQPILEVLSRVLPAAGTILEIGSGSGEHAAFFAPRLAPRPWLPSDPDAANRESIEAWRQEGSATDLPAPSAPAAPLATLPPVAPLAPVAIDTIDHRWTVEQLLPTPRITAVVSINMIHIAPWRAALGLIAGAGRILQPGDILFLYGPFKQKNQHTAPSNQQFDNWLQSQDPDWGVRDLGEVADAAAGDFDLEEVVEMPANNLSVIFRRT